MCSPKEETLPTFPEQMIGVFVPNYLRTMEQVRVVVVGQPINMLKVLVACDLPNMGV